jgi:branched-chain amino acid transport system ATP-binding protein
MMLRVEAVDTYYGLVPMLQSLSLQVAEGEVLALLGRNGAGKTTVLKTIMGRGGAISPLPAS